MRIEASRGCRPRLLAASAVALVVAAGILGTEPAQGATARIDGPAAGILTEPDVAVDPVAPDKMLAVAKYTDRNGGNDLVAYRSSDGGAGFTGGTVVDGTYLGVPAEASDPIVAFDRIGTAVFGQLVWRFPSAGGFESLLGVQSSTDGGATFGPPVIAAGDTNAEDPLEFGAPSSPSTTNDKEWLAIDRTLGPRDGFLYMAWSRVRISGTGVQRNRIAVVRSIDGGASFEPAVEISSSGRLAFGPQIVVVPNGDVHVVWADHRSRDSGERSGRILAATSADAGLTFSPPRRVARYRSGPAAYELVALAGSQTGGLQACWSRGRRFRSSRAVCSRSTDGIDWSRPVPVDSSLDGRADLVAVASLGSRFFVSFYNRTRTATTVRLYRSDDDGDTYALDSILARRAYDPMGTVGDYMGLDAQGGRVAAAYVLPRAGPRSRNSIYVDTLRRP